VVVFLLIIMIYSVSATCTNSSQIIVRLFDLNNTHISPANDVNARYAVCYDQVFSKNYTGANPNSPTGTNTVIRASDLNNAHAESPQGKTSGYINISYGNLACRLIEQTAQVQGCDANAGERAILRLSDTTNAHVAYPDFTAYKYIICCKPGGSVSINQCGDNIAGAEQCGERGLAQCGTGQSCTNCQCVPVGAIKNVEWKYPRNDTNITGRIMPGIPITLYASTTFAQNTPITFTLYENETLPNQQKIIIAVNKTRVGADGSVRFNYTFSQTDYQRADDLNEGLEEELVFNVSTGFQHAMSRELIVNMASGSSRIECVNDVSAGTVYARERNAQGSIVRPRIETIFTQSMSSNEKEQAGIACKGPDANADTRNDNCCPNGYTCTSNGCIPPVDDDDENFPDYNTCEDYGSNRELCNTNPYNLIGSGGGIIPPAANGCQQINTCYFDEGLRKCVGSTSYYTSTGSSGGGCIIRTEERSVCTNGVKKINIITTKLPGTCADNCVSGSEEREVLCGRPKFDLPFFGVLQFVSALLLICLFYFWKNLK